MAKRPKYPGLEQCLKMMHSSRGAVREDGFQWLYPRAAEYVSKLIAAFWDDENAALRGWLVELIGAAKSPAAMPFLLERVHDQDEPIRDWARVAGSEFQRSSHGLMAGRLCCRHARLSDVAVVPLQGTQRGELAT
jgi:hypothetical protein